MIAAVGGYPTDYEFAFWVVMAVLAVLGFAGAVSAWVSGRPDVRSVVAMSETPEWLRAYEDESISSSSEAPQRGVPAVDHCPKSGGSECPTDQSGCAAC